MAALASLAGPAAAADGILARLAALGALDDTYVHVIQDVAADLAPLMGGVPRFTVNTEPHGAEIGAVVVDTALAVRDAAISGAVWLKAAERGVYTIEEERLIVIGGDVLRRFAAASQLWMDGREGIDIGLILQAWSLAELEDLWSPQRNTALARDDGYLGTYEIFAGMLAFLLAHETYHILTPPQRPEQLPQDAPLWGRAKQLAWGCSALVGGIANAQRAYESRADAFAVSLLARIPDSAQGATARLKYEYGTYAAGICFMGQEMVDFAARTSDPKIGTIVATMISADLRPLARRFETGTIPLEELVPTIFAATHPSVVDRLIVVTKDLRSQPGSAFYGEAGMEGASDLMLWNMIRESICEEARKAGALE
jgi:hypothetical protein